MLRPEIASEFRSIRVFAGVGETPLSRLAVHSFVHTFPAGVTLAEQGDVPDFLFSVASGSLEATAVHEDSRSTVAIIRAGQSYSLSSVAEQAPLLSTARTLERARILMVPAASVREILGEDVAFARLFLREMALLTRCLVAEVHSLKMRTSTQRLANWLLRHLEQGGAHNVVELPFQKRILASLIGTTRESMSRAIAGLQKHGVVFEGSKVHVTDRSALERLASPSPLLDF